MRVDDADRKECTDHQVPVKVVRADCINQDYAEHLMNEVTSWNWTALMKHIGYRNSISDFLLCTQVKKR